MKLAILDRDGTLNLPGDGYIASPDEWIVLPGALEAVARLNRAGWRVVLACNQPGLGRGLFDVTVLNAIHAKMYRQLAALGARIDAVFFCPHAPQDACDCCLPRPALLAQICERYGVEAPQLLVAGASAALLQAASALGVRALHCVAANAPHADLPAGTQVHASLAAMVEQVLQEAQPPLAAATPGARDAPVPTEAPLPLPVAPTPGAPHAA